MALGGLMLNSHQWHWLGVVLAASGFLICLDASFVAKFPPPYRWFTLLYVGYVIALGATYPFPTIEDHIVLVERYAGEWQGQQPYSIDLTYEKRLRRRFGLTGTPRLTPAVMIEKDGPILKDVKIALVLPSVFKASWTKGWVENATGVFMADINDGFKNGIQKGRGVSVVEPLFITATQAVTEDVLYHITGTVRDGQKERGFTLDGKFTIELYE